VADVQKVKEVRKEKAPGVTRKIYKTARADLGANPLPPDASNNWQWKEFNIEEY